MYTYMYERNVNDTRYTVICWWRYKKGTFRMISRMCLIVKECLGFVITNGCLVYLCMTFSVNFASTHKRA